MMHWLRLDSPNSPYYLFVVAIAAASVPFAGVLVSLYSIWNLKPEYSHGVIIPLLAAWMIWQRRAELRQLPFTGSWAGLALIAVGLILRHIGELATLHTVEHYAFLLVIYGLVLALAGPVIFRRLWMPLLILIFAIPLPSFLDSALSLQLQLVSSQLGVWVIRAAGISVLVEGNIIDLGSYQLEVAEACSGLRYLLPLMTLAFIVAYLFRGPMWKRVLVFLSSIPITVIMNSLRIGFIGITVDRWGAQMAEGALHEFEGWVVFVFSTGALLLTAAVLARWGNPAIRWGEAFNLNLASPPADAGAGPAPPQTVPRSFVAALVLVVIGAVAGLAVPPPQLSSPSRAAFDEFPVQAGDWEGKRDTLESKYLDALRLDDYVLANFHNGRGSAVNFYAAYYLTQDSSRAIHSPHDCIPGGGWQITRLERREFPATGQLHAFPMNRAVVQLGPSRQLVYYWFQERGRHLTNEYVVRWYLFWDALTRHRTDGALVRFVTPIPEGGNEAKVDAEMLSLMQRVVPQLPRYIPD